MLSLLVIDNYDSFTYNLVAYCQELGAKTAVFYNDEISCEEILKINPDKILLSPGPGNPDESGVCLDIIDRFHKVIPILGVCLGHQCIGQYFGGRVIHAPTIMHGKTSIITHNQSGLFKNIKNNLSVTRYHSLIIDNDTIPDCLEVTAIVNNDPRQIMAIEHRNYQVYGVQFHPEAILSEDGHEILSNFLK